MSRIDSFFCKIVASLPRRPSAVETMNRGKGRRCFRQAPRHFILFLRPWAVNTLFRPWDNRPPFLHSNAWWRLNYWLQPSQDGRCGPPGVLAYHKFSESRKSISTVESSVPFTVDGSTNSPWPVSWPWRMVLRPSKESFEVSRFILDSYFAQLQSLSSVLLIKMLQHPTRRPKYGSISECWSQNWLQLRKWGL